MLEPVKVAVIGAGNMGQHHARNYSEMPQAKLVAIVDVNPDTKALADKYETSYYADIESMLASQQPEAVSIVVPTDMHVSFATMFLQNGTHVLLEKPIAANLEEADKLVEESAKSLAILSIGHIERFNPVVDRLKKMISGGSLGEIISIRAQRVGGFPQNEPKSDVIVDLAVHDIDIISYILETPVKLLSAHGSRTYHTKFIDSAQLLLSVGRASGSVEANWLTPLKIRKIAVTGTGGYAEADFTNQEILFYEGPEVLVQEDFRQYLARYSHPTIQHTVPGQVLEPLREELGNFLGAVRGDQVAKTVSPEDARAALKVALEAIDSIHSYIERSDS